MLYIQVVMYETPDKDSSHCRRRQTAADTLTGFCQISLIPLSVSGGIDHACFRTGIGMSEK